MMFITANKLERTQKTRSEGLAKVVYDPKSVEKFGGIVEQIDLLIFQIFNKNHVYMR